MEKQVKCLFFLPNGNTMVSDDEDHQIPEFQKSWFLLFVRFLQGKGVKVEDIEEIRLPDGNEAEYLKENHNWKIK